MTKKVITLDTVISIEGNQQTCKAFIKAYARTKCYAAFTTEGGAQLSPVKFAELLFEYAVKGKEVDEALNNFAEDIADIAAQVQDGLDSTKSATDVKREKAYAANVAEDQAEEQAEVTQQEKENARLSTIESFGASIQTGAESTRETSINFFAGMRSAFPDSVQISSDGTVTISEAATPAEIGLSFGVAAQLAETASAAGNTLQFVLGELANASVAAGIYPTMKACAEDISRRLDEAKSGKSLNATTIENFSRVAKRIPSALRNSDTSPTVYHHIANVKQVRQADGESDKAFQKREAKHAEKVTEILEKVKSGEISCVADAKRAVSSLQKCSGLKKENQITSGEYGKLILELTRISKAIPKTGALVYYVDAKNKGQSKELTREQASEALKSATAHYLNLRGFEPYSDINVSLDVITFIETSSEAPEA